MPGEIRTLRVQTKMLIWLNMPICHELKSFTQGYAPQLVSNRVALMQRFSEQPQPDTSRWLAFPPLA